MKDEKLTPQQSFWAITIATAIAWAVIVGIIYMVL